MQCVVSVDAVCIHKRLGWEFSDSAIWAGSRNRYTSNSNDNTTVRYTQDVGLRISIRDLSRRILQTPAMSNDNAATAAPEAQAPSQPKQQQQLQALGMRKNGKQWHVPRKAFRPGSGLTTTSFEKRQSARVAIAAMKAKEKEMKDEKEEDRKRRVQAIKDKRAAKEERERFEKMAEKMHKKRVERLKRKEKRNKLINS
ncbi:hypothetical protein PG989_008022 [Apiospora arundinis]